MKNKKFLILWAAVLFSTLILDCSWAYQFQPLPPFNKNDRILILAPHPDDEVIGAGGVIQEAVRLKIPIKVAYLTNGDNNELAFIVYKKHPVLSPKGLLKMGETRRSEAIAGMDSLGLKYEQMVFLGYPDFGTMSIFTRYWGKTPAFRSMLTHIKAVPYKECLSPGAPYVGESILKDLKSVLIDFRPTKIFVTGPADTNGDHRSAFLFLQVALWDLAKVIGTPQVYPFVIHAVGWPVPRGFHPELTLAPPPKLAHPDIAWMSFDLAEDQTRKKKEAISYYKSQIAYNPSYLYTFARRNEIFGIYPEIVLIDHKGKTIDWQGLENGQNIEAHPVAEGNVSRNIKSVVYAQDKDFLYIKMKFANWKDKLLGINLFLLGYRQDVPFADMPKFRIRITPWNVGHVVIVYEKRKRVSIEELKTESTKDGIVIGLPLASLHRPQYILSDVRTHIKNSRIDLTAWRTLRIESLWP